jgi:hypothetical protein
MHDAAREPVRKMGSNPSIAKAAAQARRPASAPDGSTIGVRKSAAKIFDFLGQDGVFLAASLSDVGKPVLGPKRLDGHRKTFQSLYYGEVEDGLNTELHTFGTGFWHL